MKNLFITLAFLSKFASGQSIVDHPVVFGLPSSNKSDSVNIYILATRTDTFKVEVNYGGEGSALIGRDFNFLPQVFNNVTNRCAFQIDIIPRNVTYGTIIFDVKATSKDTSISTKIKVVLTSNPNREKRNPKDLSNTPKFEFVNYTDFKGFDQDQPNGTAQSQFLFKIPVNSRKHQVNNSTAYTQWFRSIVLPNFLFNRIDKTSKGVTNQLTAIKYGDSTTYSSVISTFDFITRSNFVFNTKLAVFSIIWPHSRLQIQATGSLFKIKVDSMEVTKVNPTSGDSISKVSIGFNPIYATSFGAELYYDTHFSEQEFPFNFRFITEIQQIKMRNGEYLQADVAATLPDNSRKSSVIIDPKTGKSSSPIVTFSFVIKKNLNLKKAEETDNFLFFRYNYSWQRFKAGVPITDRPGEYEGKRLYNNFSQFQLGIDMNFDGFFKN